jgi:lysophospholipase L1-like esterase
MIGDSLMHFNNIKTFPQAGWGNGLSLLKKNDTIVIDLAENGESTKSYISKGLLARLMKELKENSYVIISFGNNDEKIDDNSRGTTLEDYKKNLLYMAECVEEFKCKPIFVTSPTRRSFKNGVVLDTHKGYPNAMIEFANEYGYDCIDLNSITKDYYNKLGEEETKSLHLFLNEGEYKAFPRGASDNSHYSPKGAIIIAELFVKALKTTCPKLYDLFEEEE